MSRLLEGYRVIESSMLLNGASTTMHLVDMGADVIKVESPFLGDYLRLGNQYPLHVQANKGKRSLSLSLATEAGRSIFYRLLDTADVFVTNAVADRNEKLGLGYEQLRERKPSIVYCQNTGFGATGPYARIPTHGQMMDAMAGSIPVEMGSDGLTHPSWRNRARTGTLLSGGEGTSTGAVYAAMHIAAGLARRERTGAGCYIDVSSADAVIANAWIGARAEKESQPEASPGNRLSDPAIARYQHYETRDGRFILFCPEETKFWEKFCRLVDRPDLIDQTHGLQLRRALQEIIHTRTQREWMAFAAEHRLPIGPTHDGIQDLLDDPQLRSREVFHYAADPDGNPTLYIGQPAIVADQPYTVVRTAPALGEHTEEILRELGYEEGEIDSFRRERVIEVPREERLDRGYGVFGGLPDSR